MLSIPIHNKPNTSPEHQQLQPSSLAIPRREVFDIRAQLMAEDDTEHNENAELISGLESGDLKPAVYEGGFKTWECAIDLAKLLVVEEVPGILSESSEEEMEGEGEGKTEPVTVIELGAGTGIPSLAILHSLLSRPQQQQQDTNQQSKGGKRRRRRVHFVFADYNSAVLRLVTVPNILLTWHQCRCRRRKIESGSDNAEDKQGELKGDKREENDDGDEREGDLEIESGLLDEFRRDLERAEISVSFVSGAWSPKFVELALSQPRTQQQQQQQQEGKERQPGSESSVPGKLLILASETIYSPSSLRAFAETLVSLQRQGTSLPVSRAKAYIAAKKVYFGVGGGVDEFLAVLKDVPGGDALVVKEKVDIEDEGVGRIILEV
ncbi:hypothetical protein AJ80_04446 [Polytolypa hystricis UAMH7299]|uniref:protein-histidine N-methyltransferase n=1 Tax=Polytolypa hystricis (strain UAMH7299) TaxID=1447883 RepID=A0A2B7YAC3_POLH7|nr:hypothetical protein AJ80_04446 [Polytolypa hystricis UAMH7299]